VPETEVQKEAGIGPKKKKTPDQPFVLGPRERTKKRKERKTTAFRTRHSRNPSLGQRQKHREKVRVELTGEGS